MELPRGLARRGFRPEGRVAFEIRKSGNWRTADSPSVRSQGPPQLVQKKNDMKNCWRHAGNFEKRKSEKKEETAASHSRDGVSKPSCSLASRLDPFQTRLLQTQCQRKAQLKEK